ncbi:MAG: radical SAM protein, partial [Pseudomonadota bacterium]
MAEVPTKRGPNSGRGAIGNPDARYGEISRDAFDDGWEVDDEQVKLKTTITAEHPKSIINRNKSPDLPFELSINPYRGCEHGCIYCFARPSHAYLGLSPGLDFETKLIARPEAPDLLQKELSAKRYEPATLAIGTNTDPYQPIERDHRIMRGVLKVLRDFRHPVGVVTKGTLIERDIDILSDLARLGLTHVGISVTTLDPDISRTMEPRVPLPKRRIETIRKLSEAGIPVRVMASPLVPGLTDHEL